MKLIKAFIITLTALLFTGCYTQLQYSQKMKKITDEEEVKGYSWSGEEQAAGEQVEAERSERDRQKAAEGGEAYIPLYYKDYEYSERWDNCNCNPYAVYNFYGSSYPDYGWYDYHRPYRSYLTLSPFYYSRWYPHHYRHHNPRHFHGSSFGFSLTWGTPFHHSFYHDWYYYDPFYYDPFWYGYAYHNPGAFNYFYYYGKGYHGGNGGGVIRDDNRVYGPRSIGTNRVVNDRTRTVSGRNAVVPGRSAVRTRSIGTSRSSDTVGRSTTPRVTRTRSIRSSSDNGRPVTRTRARGDNHMQNDLIRAPRTDSFRNPDQIRSRSLNLNSRSRDLRTIEDRYEIQQRLRSRMAPRVEYNNDRSQRSRTTFFDRVRGFFENSRSSFSNGSDRGSTIRGRSPSSSTNGSRSTVGRSTSRSSGSSVSRSRSSDSGSRSSGSSTRSRGSSRSRGNN